MVTTGPKVVVITGDANEAPVFIRALMPAWEHNRYALALIDPPSLSFWCESLEALTFNERMDLMLLFVEGMDLNRNLERYAARERSKLDRLIGTTEWRDLLHARRPTIALRELYKKAVSLTAFLPTVGGSGDAPAPGACCPLIGKSSGGLVDTFRPPIVGTAGSAGDGSKAAA